jgi:hypothetical protein
MSKEKVETKKGTRFNPLRPLQDLLNGQFLSGPVFIRQLPFLLYLCFLALIYIAYGYFTESTVKQIYRVDAELKELKAEYLTSQAELQLIRQQSNIAEAIKVLGLEESTVPPKKIVINAESLKSGNKK